MQRSHLRNSKAESYNDHMAEKIVTKFKRYPIRNFILMPDLQWPYIIRLMAIVNLSGVLMATTICVIFYLHNHAGNASPLPFIHESQMGAFVEENLMDVVVPAFIISDLVSLAIGLWLSLYSSRKISVPIYRVSKWAEVVASGDLTFRLKFRPGNDLQSLEDACNQVSETYSQVIGDLKLQLMEAKLPISSQLDAIKTQT